MKKVIELLPVITEGGAETLVRDYCLMLKKKRVEVVVVTIFPSDPSSSNYQLLKKNGIRVISLNEYNWSHFNRFVRNLWRYTTFPIITSYRLKKVIKEEKPIAIHAHLGVLEYLLRISRSLANINILYTCHSKPKRFFNRGRRLLEFISARYLFSRHSFRIIALHEEMREELNSMFNVNNTVVIHNGVDFNRFNIKEEKCEIRSSLGIPKNAFLIGHIGRFSEVKNHSFIVDVFSEVTRREPNAYLLLIGDGPLKSSIEKKIFDSAMTNYTILSHRDDIPRLLKAMDVFILPSLYEGLPVSLVEAQVMGLRCVVSDTITAECFFSENTVPLSLTLDPEEWSKVLLDDRIKGSVVNDIEVFDLNNEIEKLSLLYVGSNK